MCLEKMRMIYYAINEAKRRWEEIAEWQNSIEGREVGNLFGDNEIYTLAFICLALKTHLLVLLE